MRSQLTPEIKSVQSLVADGFDRAFEALGSKAYVSLVVERRWNRRFVLDPKSQNLNEEIKFGWVLRAFDGKTLFERASDQFSSEAFAKATEELSKEVQTLHQFYKSPTWSERKKEKLENEILSQIPEGADAQTWVHFGTRMELPLSEQNEDIMKSAEEEYQNFQNLIQKKKRSVDFSQLFYMISVEDFLFLDSSVRMSQSLVRPARFVVAVKGNHQVRLGRGSLGGHEILDPQNNTSVDQLFKKLDDLEKAEKLKPGKYKVLLSPTLTGVFAHEAFGHSQEADTWMRNRSKARELYENQTRVGNDFATILNNPAIYQNGEEETGAWGSYFFDEEGWLAQEQVLVEKGYLRPPMTDLASSFRLNLPRSANGKRQDWSHGVYSRQTNTYFAAGDKTFKELLSQVDDGFLATESYGGMEDPKGMGIQVGIQYLEEVKNGQLTGRTFVAPNGGAVQMTGYVPEYLNSILGVSKIEAFSDEPDRAKHPWNEVGGCGKYHKEIVKAGCGGPYLLLNDATLG